MMNWRRILVTGMVAGTILFTGCSSNLPETNQGNRNGQRVVDAVNGRTDSYDVNRTTRSTNRRIGTRNVDGRHRTTRHAGTRNVDGHRTTRNAAGTRNMDGYNTTRNTAGTRNVDGRHRTTRHTGTRNVDGRHHTTRHAGTRNVDGRHHTTRHAGTHRADGRHTRTHGVTGFDRGVRHNAYNETARYDSYYNDVHTGLYNETVTNTNRTPAVHHRSVRNTPTRSTRTAVNNGTHNQYGRVGHTFGYNQAGHAQNLEVESGYDYGMREAMRPVRQNAAIVNERTVRNTPRNIAPKTAVKRTTKAVQRKEHTNTVTRNTKSTNTAAVRKTTPSTTHSTAHNVAPNATHNSITRSQVNPTRHTPSPINTAKPRVGPRTGARHAAHNINWSESIYNRPEVDHLPKMDTKAVFAQQNTQVQQSLNATNVPTNVPSKNDYAFFKRNKNNETPAPEQQSPTPAQPSTRQTTPPNQAVPKQTTPKQQPAPKQIAPAQAHQVTPTQQSASAQAIPVHQYEADNWYNNTNEYDINSGYQYNTNDHHNMLDDINHINYVNIPDNHNNGSYHRPAYDHSDMLDDIYNGGYDNAPGSNQLSPAPHSAPINPIYTRQSLPPKSSHRLMK